MSSLNCGGALLSLGILVDVSSVIVCERCTYNAASRSAAVMASMADGGTEKPSESFCGWITLAVLNDQDTDKSYLRQVLWWRLGL